MLKPDPKVKHKPRKQSGRDPKYLAWIRTQPCAACGFPPPCQAAHQRCLGGAGIGIKPDDKSVLPLCFTCHAKEHAGSLAFWEQGTREKTREYVQKIINWHLNKFKDENK